VWCYTFLKVSVSGHRKTDDGAGKTALRPVEKEMKALKLPQTDSVEELARFWDTRDLTDFEDHLEEVTEPVFVRQGERVLALRLDVDEVRAVEEIARSRGLERSELLGEWVREKLGSLRTGGP
jgi:hypothetical protein